MTLHRSSRRRPGPERAPSPIPAHPYRDTAILHVVLGVVICAFALVTGGDMVTAVLVALAYVVVATGWSWWRFSQRLRAAAVAPRDPAPQSEEPS